MTVVLTNNRVMTTLVLASSPSRVNSLIFLYTCIYMFVTGDVHIVILYVPLTLRAHSPTRQHCVAFHNVQVNRTVRYDCWGCQEC